MVVSRTFVAFLSTIALTAVPTYAQHRGGGGGRSHGGGRVAAPRSFGAPRGVFVTRGFTPGAIRTGFYRGPRVYAAPRVYAVPRVYGARSGVVVGRALPRVIAPRFVGGSAFRFYRPYYVFRPRFSRGFGLWVGFPVGYPYFSGYYPSPYDYGYYSAYPYPPPYYSYPYNDGYGLSPYPPPYSGTPYPSYGSITAQPPDQGANAVGGVSFEITPTSAEVYVDGMYLGTVGEFTPSSRPLNLAPGRHHISVRAPGYRTLEFDADIIGGQIIPYRGTMQP